MARPVQLRRRAAGDTDAALDHYRIEAGRAVAVRFVDALERALTHVARHPHNGSPHFAYELGIPELRSWPISRLPYVIFYVEHDNQIDVWRVLHTRRDVPAAAPGPARSSGVPTSLCTRWCSESRVLCAFIAGMAPRRRCGHVRGCVAGSSWPA